MSFDRFSSRSEHDAATAQIREITDETSWTHPRDRMNVHDNASSDRDRTSDMPVSVTLWDEAAPAPLAMRDSPEDRSDG